MDKFVKRQRCNDDIGNRSISISYEVSPNELKEIVRDICTVDDLPLNTFEKSGIKRLIKPITEQLKKNDAAVPLNFQMESVKSYWKVAVN